MKIKDLVKFFITHTCIYTTAAFSLAMLFFAAIGNEAMTIPFAVVTYFLILGFCAFLALANMVFFKTKRSIWTRVLVHVALTVCGFLVCIYERFDQIGTPVETLTVFSLLAAVTYALAFGSFLLIRYLVARKKEQKDFQNSVKAAQSEQKRR